MFRDLLKFECFLLRRNKSGYILLCCFLLLGLLLGLKANFPFEHTVKNGTYILNYIIGIASLLCIFSTTLMAAQLLFREKDACFEPILYATPIRKAPYVLSRFAIIFCISLLCYLLLICGLLAGQMLDAKGNGEYGAFRVLHYLNPFLLLLLPNIFFCTAIACSIGLLTRSKMLVYVSGIFIYFLYWGVSFMTNSPLIANSTPMSAESMGQAAIADPFGIAAFLEQAYYWTAAQRNNQLLQLSGHLLINRLIYLGLSLVLFYIAYRRFVFATHQESEKKKPNKETAATAAAFYKAIPTITNNFSYELQCLLSLLKIELRNIIKGIPLWVVLIGWLGFFSIETLSDLGGNSRIPEQLATTAVIVKNILSAFPLVALLVLLFYANEIYWRSHSYGFDKLEQSTPVNFLVLLGAKWLALILIMLLLLSATILTGSGMQLLKGYPAIDLRLYASLYYLIGLPLTLSAGLVISILVLVRNRYSGMAVAGILILLCNTSMGSMLNIYHPLLKYTNAFTGTYSELNGFGRDLVAFNYKIVYGVGLTWIIFILAARLRYKKQKYTRLLTGGNIVLLLAVITTVWAGGIIFSKTKERESREMVNDRKQAYENKYSYLRERAQPVITAVKADIDLYPSSECYTVKGVYTLVNKSKSAIDTLFIYADHAMRWNTWKLEGAQLIQADTAYGYFVFSMDRALQLGDSVKLAFGFRFTGDPFNATAPYNTMIANGSFIRISRYFPALGYNNAEEIEDPQERKRRHMKPRQGLLPLTAARPERNDFILFDITLSTDGDQTAICIGDLKRAWRAGGRNYFQYSSPSPVPFRFAVASGRYTVKKVKKGKVTILVYYHPEHDRNIAHLVRTAVNSLDYYERNFSAYPYTTLRFVEISAFTSGFAGTAYPATLFINESFGYRNKIDGNPDKDILNEMVSHELSHTWWGNAGIAPDYREGNLLMTETLAMYAELMAYKNTYGEQYLPGRVKVHKSIYLSSRSLADEPPLYRLDPERPYLAYDKGMVVMYQLYLYLGAEKMNKALRAFYVQHTYPSVPVSTDLLQAFYAVAGSTDSVKIKELFEQVVTYDLRLGMARVHKDAKGGYTLVLKGEVEKYLEDGKGGSVPVPFPESLEVQVLFKDGSSDRLMQQVVNNKFGRVLQYTKEPVSVVLDPDGKLLNRSDESKEKKVSWH